MTEAEWEDKVMSTAAWLQWVRVHIFNVQLPNGHWVVPYKGDDGLPDLILARRGVVLLRELKLDTGRVQPNQRKWIQNGAKIWRPRDFFTVVLPELKGAA